MREVCLEGPGHYLGHPQTLSVMQTEYVYPAVADRTSPKVMGPRSASRTWCRRRLRGRTEFWSNPRGRSSIRRRTQRSERPSTSTCEENEMAAYGNLGKFYINGEWVEPSGSASLMDVINPRHGRERRPGGDRNPRGRRKGHCRRDAPPFGLSVHRPSPSGWRCWPNDPRCLQDPDGRHRRGHYAGDGRARRVFAVGPGRLRACPYRGDESRRWKSSSSRRNAGTTP